MSALKIKDAQGNWIEVPMIKGDKGDKGEQGDTYELTEQDKQDIADLVDVPEPLKYIKDEPNNYYGSIIEGSVEGSDANEAKSDYSHAEGIGTKALGYASHSEGGSTQAKRSYSHAEGYGNVANGDYSHVEGVSNTSSNRGAHAEGSNNTASGENSHAEGNANKALGYASHAEGSDTTAVQYASHTEGTNSVSNGNSAHAEGFHTTASGTYSHAEGNYSVSLGANSHSEGANTVAQGLDSHAEGTSTIASGMSQHVQGKFNIPNDTSALIVGNGTDESHRSNAYTLDWNGNGVYAGKLTVGTAPTNDMDVATKKYVDDVKGASIHICSSAEYDSTTRIPTIQNPDERTFYLVPSEDGTSPDLFVEWAYVNNAWEMFGNTTVDLSGYLTDVQINGTSVVTNGVANVPVATSSIFGVTKPGNGLFASSGALMINKAPSNIVKAGTQQYAPIVPYNQHESTFYGLAKAAGDTTQSQSSNAVGTYTDEAKGAIQSMLGIDSLIAPTETNPFTNAHGIGDLFIINGTLYKAKTAIAVGDVLDDGVNVEGVSVDDVAVKDVQVNGTSVLSNGVANIPIANGKLGLVNIGGNYGLKIYSNGVLSINSASSGLVKAGTWQAAPITAKNQHESVFYGLAKASGDTTQSQSDNAVGTYTDDAKASIKSMLGVVDSYDSLVVNVTGTDPVITAQPSYRYNCGEVTTLTITPPSSGTIDFIFTSGTTPTVLNLPNTVKMPSWWIGVEANTTYEMCITDGVYCGVMSWDA